VEHAVIMGMREAIKDTDRNSQRFVERERATITGTHHFGEIAASDELHIDNNNAIDFIHGVDGDQGWMSEAIEKPCFGKDAVELGSCATHFLKRNLPT
jgi:hypothetical protein